MDENEKALLKSRGGIASDKGNSYRKEVASFLVMQLLWLPTNAYVRIENNDGDDIEFFDGTTTYFIECKVTASITHWTIGKLREEGILEFFSTKYSLIKQNISAGAADKYRVVLMSPSSCSDIAELAYLAKKNAKFSEKNTRLIKQLKLQEDIVASDYLRYLEISNYSDFSLRFMLEPVYKQVFGESILLEKVQNLVHRDGLSFERITKELLLEKIPELGSWLLKDISKHTDSSVVPPSKFYRQSLSIVDLKDRIKQIKDLSSKGKLTKKSKVLIREAFLAYNTNIKLVLALLELFSSYFIIDQGTADFLVSCISGNPIYQWHFFKRLKDPKWFSLLKNSLIHEIVTNTDDYGVKDVLLQYLEQLDSKFTPDVEEMLSSLVVSTKDYRILKHVATLIGKLSNPSDKSLKILGELSTYTHSWVRIEVAEVLRAPQFLQKEESINILESIITGHFSPEDVVVGSSTLSLNFQGRDNENHVFNEACTSLEEFIKTYPIKTILTFCNLLNTFSEEDSGRYADYERVGSLVDDHSYIWYSQSGFNKRDHEYDRKERLAMELEYCLDYLVKNDSAVMEETTAILLKEHNAIVFLLLIKTFSETSNYMDFKKKLLLNGDVWRIYGLRTGYMQDLLKSTGIKDSKDPLIQEIKKLITGISDSRVRKDAEECLQEVLSEKDHFDRAIGPITVGTFESEVVDLSKYTDATLAKICQGKKVSGFKLDNWSLRDNILAFGSAYPERGLKLVKVSSSFKEEILGNLVDGIIASPTTDIIRINYLASIIPANDTWARLSIIRKIKDICQHNIDSLDKDALDKTIASIELLYEDTDPAETRIKISTDNDVRDLMSIGINSVRGVSVEAAIYVALKYPENEKIRALLSKAASDPSQAVVALLVNYLGYLQKSDYYYKLGSDIVDSCIKLKIPGLDYEIIRYLDKLGKVRLQEKTEIILQLFDSYSETVQHDIGSMVGYRWYFWDLDIKAFVDKIFNKQLKYQHAREGFAFSLESSLGEHNTKPNETIEFLKRLVSPKEEPSPNVRERASYVLSRDTLSTKLLEKLIREGFFSTLKTDIFNPRGSHHALEYLKRCNALKEDINLIAVALCELVSEESPVVQDHYMAKELTQLVVSCMGNSALTGANKERLLSVIDILLGIGYEEAYDAFRTML